MLTTRQTTLLLLIARYLQHGGTHAQGADLAEGLLTLLSRLGPVTVLSDETYRLMQAQIEEAERLEAEQDAHLQT